MNNKDRAKERLKVDAANCFPFPEERENRIEMESPATCYDPERTIDDLETEIERLKHELESTKTACDVLMAENKALRAIQARIDK